MYNLFLTLHVLGACIWAGGHLVLALSVLPKSLKSRDIRHVTDFEASFERIGIPALVIQVITGLWLADYYVPFAGLFSLPAIGMQHLIWGKLGLLLFTLLLAAHARLRLIPKLSPATLPQLAVHIWLVTLTAAAMVVLGVSVRWM